ncbi:MAG TPA: SIS domain-containing protein [Thermoflexales bacterium]|nr:SIS domain-containing protein [Thermoflexales bacterium]HQW36452.1 SIS domain-containing protein [Thermoflexales bacterium]
MRNLDDQNTYATVDPRNLRGRILEMGKDCQNGYATGKSLAPLPGAGSIRQIVIAAMGGSAAGASLAAALATQTAAVPIILWKEYGLPAFAKGPETLVMALSNSGNTEEIASAFEQATQRGCAAVAITTGGRLAQMARAAGAGLITYEWTFPISSVPWTAFAVLGALVALGVLPEMAPDVSETEAVLAAMNDKLRPESPAMHNGAKRMAGQFMDRLPVMYGAGIFAPVAKLWKAQMHERAKSLAASEEMPDLNHNAVESYDHPQAVWQKSIVIALRGAADHPRVARRYEATTTLMLEAGLNQDSARAQGHSQMAQMFSLVLYGEWVTYYTAIIAGTDPLQEHAVTRMKEILAS